MHSYIVFTTSVFLLVAAKINNFLEDNFPEIILCRHTIPSA